MATAARPVEPLVLIRRRFTVAVPCAEAWDRLADVSSWPSWAHHIRSVELEPPGPVTATSAGAFRLAGGIPSRFHMTRFDPPDHWEWCGRLATLTIHYDHRFTSLDDGTTELEWIVAATGLGARTLGRAFALVYARNLDRAIPRLQATLAQRHDGP